MKALSVLAISAVLATLCRPAAAEDWTFRQIAIAGAVSVEGVGLNDRGVVAGTYLTPAGYAQGVAIYRKHGFIDDHGTGTTLDVPGAKDTSVAGISQDGVVAGQYTVPKYTGEGNAFVWKNGVFSTYGHGLGTYTIVNAVSGNGIVAGNVHADRRGAEAGLFEIVAGRMKTLSLPHSSIGNAGIYGINDSRMLAITLARSPLPDNPPAFIASPQGGLSAIKVPDGRAIVPAAINNAGVVAGSYISTTTRHEAGFVFANGSVTSIAVPGASDTAVAALNEAGDLAGLYAMPDIPYTAFTEHSGVFTSLVPPGAVPGTSGALAINAARQVLVYYIVTSPQGVAYSQTAIASSTSAAE